MSILVIHFNKADYESPVLVSKALKSYGYTADVFGMGLRVVDMSGDLHSLTSDTYDVYQSLEDALSSVTGDTYIAEPNDGISIRDYQYNENDIFVIGPDYGSMTIPNDLEYTGIHIPSQSDKPLWATVAAGVIGYGCSI